MFRRYIGDVSEMKLLDHRSIETPKQNFMNETACSSSGLKDVYTCCGQYTIDPLSKIPLSTVLAHNMAVRGSSQEGSISSSSWLGDRPFIVRKPPQSVFKGA